MDRRRKFDRRQSMESAEVGEIPPPLHPSRRAACGLDLHLFLATYFPHSTGKDVFSPDHCRVVDRIEHCLRSGGRFVNAVYRGFAKTTITELAALWAALYGYRQFIAIFGADEAAANQLIDSIARELEENDLLAADFPEVCLPFQHLDGKPQRGRSQTQSGEHTHIKLGSSILVLPTIWTDLERRICTPASGCILRARGLLGGTRGMAHKRPDGVKARPDFALIDDPQTDESATSAAQVEKRLGLIRKAVLKSAGHAKSMACVINATVIAADDLVDQLLDRERNPAWQGERIKMVRSWSDAHETLWLEYARFRREFNADIPGDQQRAHRDATSFYITHRDAMDAGCVVSWRACYDAEAEVSAIQHAYNLFFDDPPEVFASECQNEPAQETPDGVQRLDSLTIARKLNGYRRGEVPEAATVLTAFVDIHDDVLYWAVCGFDQQMTAWVVDYGTWPDQKRTHFLKRQASVTIRRKFPKRPIEEVRVLAIEAVLQEICTRDWPRADGTTCRVDKCLIDAGHAPHEVEMACRRAPQAAVLQMSRGKGISASALPIREYRRKPGWRFGDDWYIPAGQNRVSRVLWFDANAWKTWLWARLSTPLAVVGSMSLPGKPGDRATDHRLLGDHLVSETPAESSSSNGRTVIEWHLLPGRDNHWLDCLVGCGVAASLLGCALHRPSSSPRRSRRTRALTAARKKHLT